MKKKIWIALVLLLLLGLAATSAYTVDRAEYVYVTQFGRHVAMFFPLAEFPALKERLKAAGAVLFDPIRPTPFARFFFREPINGYVFEVIDQARSTET